MIARIVSPRTGAPAIAALVAVTACSMGGYDPSPLAQKVSVAQSAAIGTQRTKDVSVLKQLKKQVVIGSTVDPTSGAQNPYGLTVAPITAGKLTKGDLIACDFNARSNVQGTGRSIVALHLVPKSEPVHVSSLKPLGGCDALALDVDDTIWAAAMVSDANPVIAATGKLLTAISGKPFDQPWGQVLARNKSTSAFYETNAGNGSVVRINLGSPFTFDVIATGFPVNHGKPGTVLAPSGLAYDAGLDTLYFADGQNNTIVAFKNVTTIPKDGIKAIAGGTKFSGPAAADARVVFAGKPLNGPISTALLPNGNLVVGNTLDPAGKNLIIEVSATGKLLDARNVDTGAAGALFGIVATGTDVSNTKVYFNDDNDNNVQVLER